MTWFRVDDNLAFHPKVMTAGNAAMGLWVRAGSWVAHQRTDGDVPKEIATALGTSQQIRALMDVGLWLPCGQGYEFHQWTERQPTRAEIEAAHGEMGLGGRYGNHRRWHVNRGTPDPNCKLCRAENVI